MKIFVLTLDRYKDRWNKYDLNKYTLFKGVEGYSLDENNEYMKKIKCRYNIKLEQKQNVCGCLLSHLKIMKYIVDNKLNDVLVIEDDALINFDLLNNIRDLVEPLSSNKLIYIGGIIRALTLKNKEFNYDNIVQNLNNGLNKIDYKKFKIGGAHGLYYSKYTIAENIYNHIKNKDRVSAIDNELCILQKNNMIDNFIYPAISYLDLKEARKGFSGKYGIPRDMRYY